MKKSLLLLLVLLAFVFAGCSNAGNDSSEASEGTFADKYPLSETWNEINDIILEHLILKEKAAFVLSGEESYTDKTIEYSLLMYFDEANGIVEYRSEGENNHYLYLDKVSGDRFTGERWMLREDAEWITQPPVLNQDFKYPLYKYSLLAGSDEDITEEYLKEKWVFDVKTVTVTQKMLEDYKCEAYEQNEADMDLIEAELLKCLNGMEDWFDWSEAVIYNTAVTSAQRKIAIKTSVGNIFIDANLTKEAGEAFISTVMISNVFSDLSKYGDSDGAGKLTAFNEIFGEGRIVKK